VRFLINCPPNYSKKADAEKGIFPLLYPVGDKVRKVVSHTFPREVLSGTWLFAFSLPDFRLSDHSPENSGTRIFQLPDFPLMPRFNPVTGSSSIFSIPKKNEEVDELYYSALSVKYCDMNDQEIDIMIVEDNEEDAELTIRALKKQSKLNILHVADGMEALDYIYAKGKFSTRNPELKPRVIFLDLKMPKVSGLDVLQKIKTDPNVKSIPVVVLASSEDDPNIKRSYDLGANSYIVKPVGAENFVKTITDLGLYWLMTNKI
jgi:two-component system, response regulator